MEETEYTKLPIEDRCVHKLWKARLSGYEDAAKLFRKCEDKSPEWSKYLGLLKKFVTDSNAPAQEKGLEAVLAFVENYGLAGKTVGEVMTGLIQKCVGATKARTKDLAAQIALMYIEIEKYESVINELLRGTESKNPKTSCGCLTILTQALREFGAKVINVSKIIKKIPILLANRDQSVRGEVRSLLVEIYRWTGPAIKPQLNSLKPVQLTELEAEFEKVKPGVPTPSRLLRSQLAKKAAQGIFSEEMVQPGDRLDGGEGEYETDPTEYLEPVNILSKLPKDFYTQLEAKKWTERRDALELLEKELSAAPKLEGGDYGDLMRVLKKIVAQDSNVIVIASALRCLCYLASGLKKKFSPYVGVMLPTILEKFKEKKQNVVQALREVVDAIFLTTQLDQISEDLIAALDNKNPAVKTETTLFLSRCFSRCTPVTLNKKLLKLFVAALLKTLNDSEAAVREASVLALATAMKVVGEKAIEPFLADIGEAKMSKIKTSYVKIELNPIKAPKRETPCGSEILPSKQEESNVLTRGAPKNQKSVKKESTPTNNKPPIAKENECNNLGVINQHSLNYIPSHLIKILSSDDIEQRLSAFEQLVKIIKKKSTTDAAPLLRAIVLKNGFHDESKIVYTKLEAVKFVAENYVLSDCENISSLIIELVKKLPESEYVDAVSSCLATIAESIGCDDMAIAILCPEVLNDNQFWASALTWLSEGIINYSLSFSEDFIQTEAKKALTCGNSSVRSAGLALIGSLHMITKKDDSNAAPAKDKMISKKKKNSRSNDGTANIDLLTLIESTVSLQELSDDSWKIKYDALSKVKTLVDSTPGINPNIRELQPTIEALIGDKSSKVVVCCLNLLSSLAKSMGPQCRQLSRYFIPKIIKNLAHPKNWVRGAVISTLNVWGSVAGYKEFFDNDNLGDAVKSLLCPVSKVELWTWLVSVLSNVQSVPKDGLIACLPYLYQSLEDRNVDVRKAANEVVVSFITHLGYDCMLAACDNIKGSTAQIKCTLEKNRGCVPQPLEPLPPNRGLPSNIQTNKSKLGPGSSAAFTKPSKPSSIHVASRTSMLKRKEDESNEFSGPLLEQNNFKHQRIISEQKLKTLKWNFTSPRPEFIELLKDQMTQANFNQTLITHMFHVDFRYHIKAIDSMAEDLVINREGLMANLDLILKWMTLRFFDTNPSVLLKGLEYLTNVFNCLIQDGYSLLDSEGSSFLPYLLLKAGDPKDIVRNNVKTIYRLISSLYPHAKMFSFLMEGLKSKNARQRSEMLEQLSWMIENFSLNACTNNSVVALKEIARHIGDRDVTVRNAALNCMVAVYFLVGEKMYKLIGQLSQKDATLLEERIKRAYKNRPVASVKPLQNESNSVCLPLNRQHVTIGNKEETESVKGESTIHSTGSDNGGIENNELQRTFTIEVQKISLHNDESSSDVSHDAKQIKESSSPSVKGPFGLDPLLNESVQFQPPAIENVDLHFLKEPSKMASVRNVPVNPSISVSSNGTAAIKWELNQIVNSDLEKAVHAMGQLETILYSNKAHSLRPYLDFMVQQLVHQLKSLNQTTHPDLVNCYRGNFSLIMKLSDNKILCQEVSEENLLELIKQLLILLTERRLEVIGQDMFIKVVNNVVIRLLESANKTSVICALIRLLHETINPPSNQHFQDLLIRCLWKLNRMQPLWDLELNYPKILIETNYFFQDYPSAWWKNQESDIPLRTIKTILHTMVKMRGNYVKKCLKNVTSVPAGSEMLGYIKKVIKHLKLDETNVDPSVHEKNTYDYVLPQSQKIPPEIELPEIIRMISETKDTSEGLRQLYEFKKSNLEVDLDIHLSNEPATVQQLIKQSSAAYEMKLAEYGVSEMYSEEKGTSAGFNEKPSTNIEFEVLLNRLGQWKELTSSCLPTDNNNALEKCMFDPEQKI